MTVRDGSRRLIDLGPYCGPTLGSRGAVPVTDAVRIIGDVTNYNRDNLTPEEAKARARAWNRRT